MLRREEREIRNDSNGNAIPVEDRKESLMRILSDTLRRPRSRELDNLYVMRDDEDYPESNFNVDNKSLPNCTSDDMLDFNPGDRLSSPIPPLASKSELSSPPGVGKFDYVIRNHLKDCHLSSVLHTARRCVKQLSSVKKGLTYLISQDERLSQGKKIPNPGSDYELIAKLGECVMMLTRQAFTPAHQMYTAALGLHLSEDLIRNPLDPALLDFKTGYIVRAPWTSIIHTQMKIRSCVDSATETYHRFGRDNATRSECHRLFQAEQMQNVIILLMHAFQDLYATALGCNDIFKVLLHIEDYGEKILQDFLISLESIERSELLIQVQNLRRSFDDIVIKLEQLSWAAYAVFRLASGKSVTPSPDSSLLKITGKVTNPEDASNPVDAFDENDSEALTEVTVPRPRSRESRTSSSRLAEPKESVSSSRERSRRGYSSDREDVRYRVDSEKQLKSSLRKERSSLGQTPSPRSRRASPSALSYERFDDNTPITSKHSSKSSSKSSVPGSSLKSRGSKSKYLTNDPMSPYQGEDSRGKKHKMKPRSCSLDGRGYYDDSREGKTSGNSSSSYGSSGSHRSKSKDKSYRGNSGELRSSDFTYRKNKS